MVLKFSQALAPISDLKTRAREIVKQLHDTGRPVLITQRGRLAAVMESAESYEKRQEFYETLEDILKALREAEAGELHDHKKALKILESF